MKLTPQQQLALGRRWILQPRLDEVKLACSAAYAVCWTRQVKYHCEQQRDRGASSCLDLAESLGMSRGNFSRYFPLYDGTYDLKPKVQMPDPMLRYRVALALRVPEHVLSSELRVWIAESVKWLAVTNHRTSYQADPATYLPFADYLRCERHDDHGDQICLEGARFAQQQHLDKSLDQLHQEIGETAQMVGEILEGLGMELQS